MEDEEKSSVKFEWDDAKAIGNVEKHGITFGEATEVFYDPNALEAHDTENSDDEDRFVIIGYSANRLLFVVFAMRIGNMIRIISARKPTPAERDLYEKGGR
ncbi:MAG TPA: BrnT family toxin [Pyrinomonadaceae bacterium]